MKKMISIVTPAYNEEAVVDELAKRLKGVMAINERYDFEVIIVENGSWDSSFEKLEQIYKEDPRFKIVQLSRNFGTDGGITAGLNCAKGDAAVIMGADLQDPPEMITEFIKNWENGYEIVYGIINSRDGLSSLRKVLYPTFYRLINWMTNDAIPKNAGDFRLIDKKVYSAVNEMKERNRFMRGIIAWTGFKRMGIPYERPSRYAGESKADFFSALNLAMTGILSFSDLPLKISASIGFIISLLSIGMIIVELGLFFVYGRVVPGFTTLIVVILFLFGILLSLLGVIGIYIGRIYEEVKQRPNYIVKNYVGFK
jgi:polyisoprenyl-phosphate glycosyltransferase